MNLLNAKVVCNVPTYRVSNDPSSAFLMTMRGIIIGVNDDTITIQWNVDPGPITEILSKEILTRIIFVDDIGLPILSESNM